MNVAELKTVASGLGITGTTKMRKDDLVAAISARRSDGSGSSRAAETPERTEERRPRRAATAPATAPAASPESASTTDRGSDDTPASGQGQQDGRLQHGRDDSQRPQRRRVDRADRRAELDDRDHEDREQQDRDQQDRDRHDQGQSERDPQRRDPRDRGQGERDQDETDQRERGQRSDTRQQGQGRAGERAAADRGQQSDRQGDSGAEGDRSGQGGQGGQGNRYDDDSDGRGGRRRNRQRSRDRKRTGRPGLAGGQDDEPELQVNDDDVLVPVAGILDVLDNYAFVRTSGYLPGANDVYVPLGVVKKNGLRKGDAITGSVKALRDGEQPQGASARQKFNALVRLDTINGQTPEQSRARVEFGKLTPLYPQERLRLETESGLLTTRIIDLIAPIGKGQRGLIVAPSKAGKTMVMQAIANAITANNPECHLMVVLVDERPEEVTDMQRAVKGEVISSTFDRPAEDHTTVAELAIERAKRLVEMGHDVVVLLDSITKLGRAYNLAAPASGRILSGGVDSAALYPPKKFFGAARNIENGGSLTILATALVETGSRMDEVIFEEFKGTGNMELRLSRDLANRRIFPAVDVNASSTRREEILLGAEELKIMWKLRRVLAALESQQGIELLIDRLKKTRSNVEFLRQVQLTSSNKLDGDED
ncbi:MAG: transcription termination factor Rho [Actinomycetota bacterium]|nr:transcription termination factor Rho [Actinomycetota bacterium]